MLHAECVLQVVSRALGAIHAQYFCVGLFLISVCLDCSHVFLRLIPRALRAILLLVVCIIHSMTSASSWLISPATTLKN